MKRAGFTMIELIFVIVILGILAAVAVPKLSGVKDDALLANANENFCIAVKSSLLNRSLRSGTIADFNLSNSFNLPTGFTFTDTGAVPATASTGVLSLTDGNLNAKTAGSLVPAIYNDTNSIYVYFIDGDETDAFGCMIGSTATSSTTAAEARTKMAGGSNYL